jgi:site-specific recombinase XerC
MDRLRAPKVPVPEVPVFTSVELSDLERACRGGTFAQRRDAAIVAVFTATGIRLSEMAGLCYDPDDPARNDLNLDRREIRITGKGGTARTVKIGTRPPAPWTATCGPGPATRRPGGPGCGWA